MVHSPASSPSPYYSVNSAGLLFPVALLYSLTCHLWLRFTGQKVLAVPPSLLVPADDDSASAKTNKERRVAIVTGSNTGIGFETARTLVIEYGYTVILACRSRDKALQAVDRIHRDLVSQTEFESSTTRMKKRSGGQAIFIHPLDLASEKSILEFSQIVQKKFRKIHVLVNNAGLNAKGTVEVQAKDGGSSTRDLTFQSNFLGHFLLTASLMDTFSPMARVVNLSSVMHHFARTTSATNDDIQNPRYWKDKVAAGKVPAISYCQSKLAALLFTIELNRRYKSRIQSIAVNPGAVNSDIWRDFPRLIVPIFRAIFLTNREGCQTSVAAVVGEFFVPNRENESQEEESLAVYLQPYYQLFGEAKSAASSKLSLLASSSQPLFPAFEMVGPSQGYRVTAPRLPPDGGLEAARALWLASEKITGAWSLWPATEHQRQ